MNGDYISRAEAWQEIFDSAGKVLEHESPEAESTLVYQIATRTAMRAVESIRPADVRPVVRGEWRVVSDGCGNGEATAHICECSECGDTIWVYKKAERRWNYCPNCGADMREESA